EAEGVLVEVVWQVVVPDPALVRPEQPPFQEDPGCGKSYGKALHDHSGGVLLTGLSRSASALKHPFLQTGSGGSMAMVRMEASGREQSSRRRGAFASAVITSAMRATSARRTTIRCPIWYVVSAERARYFSSTIPWVC